VSSLCRCSVTLWRSFGIEMWIFFALCGIRCTSTGSQGDDGCVVICMLVCAIGAEGWTACRQNSGSVAE
jgi:hypothetical protein